MADDQRPLDVLLLSNLRRSPQVAEHVQRPDPDLLRNGLLQRNIRVSVESPGAFPINPLASKGTFYAGFDPARALRTLLFRRRIDAIISVGESNVAAILALAPLLNYRPKIILREISHTGWRVRDRILDYVLPRVDGIMILTPHQRSWAEARFRLKTRPHLVGFAVDEHFFSMRQVGRQMDDAGFVLTVGDDMGRDYATFLDACRDGSFPIVARTGSIPEVPTAMRGRLRIAPRGSFADLRTLYERASVVVVPLREVDHPSGITSLLEAMAMRCAVVTTDMATTRHIVRDRVNALLVPPGDARAMRAAIEELVRDPGLRMRLGLEARRTVEVEHSYESYVDRFAACIREVVDGSAEPSAAAGHLGTASPA